MTIFLRARDVKEYIELLEEMVLSMNQDLFEVLKCSDQYLTEEALLKSYIISANSPTEFLGLSNFRSVPCAFFQALQWVFI